jgi:iron(III) transport system substrate-binding protein
MNRLLAGGCLVSLLGSSARAGQIVTTINVCSAHQEAADETLFSAFIKATGSKVERVENTGDGILQRLVAEGSTSNADVVLLGDKILHAVSDRRRAQADGDGKAAWFGPAIRATQGQVLKMIKQAGLQ